MTSRRLSVIAVLIAIVAIGVLLVGVDRHARREPPPDLASARAIILAYLRALEAQNRDGIAQLVPANYEATQDIEERLRSFGGARTDRAEIQMATDISPKVLVVKIRTIGQDAHKLAWTENLVWHDGAWQLVLGQSRNRPSGLSTPSEIQRPEP